jgi:hypothetical protein
MLNPYTHEPLGISPTPRSTTRITLFSSLTTRNEDK